MTRLNVQVRGPIARSTWKRLRRRLTQGTATSLIVAGGFVAVVAATTVEPTLSGIWVAQGGSEFRIYHLGNSVEGAFYKVSPGSRRVGAELGGIWLRARFTERGLVGTIGRAHPVEDWDRCDGAGRPRTYPAEIEVNEDDTRMTVTWSEPRIDFSTCRTFPATPASNILTRRAI